MRANYSRAALHVVFDAHWWANYVPPSDEEGADSRVENIDGDALSDEAFAALFK